MTTNLSYYAELLNASFTKKFLSTSENGKPQGWLVSDPVTAWMSDKCESILEAPETGLIDNYQNFFDIAIETYTLGELAESAPLQLQNALQPRVVEKIWTDTRTGIAKTEQLLKPPVVSVGIDGQLTLIGGNHRIAAIILSFLASGHTLEEIQEVAIKCIEYTINIEAVTEAKTLYDIDGAIIAEPSDDEVAEDCKTLLLALWEADNGSRAVNSVERVGAQMYRAGIDRTDNQSIYEVLFPPKGVKPGVTLKIALFWLSLNHAANSAGLSALIDDNGDVINDPSLVQAMFSVPSIDSVNAIPLTNKSFEGIMGGFFAGLQTKTIVEVNGKGKEVKRKLYALDFKDHVIIDAMLFNLFAPQEETNTDITLFEEAIDEYMKKEDSGNNIARNAVSIGRLLADKYHATFGPAIDIQDDVKPTHKPVRKARKLGLGL